MAVQVFGNESRFNEKVTFLKNIDIDGNLILGGNFTLESDITRSEEHTSELQMMLHLKKI